MIYIVQRIYETLNEGEKQLLNAMVMRGIQGYAPRGAQMGFTIIPNTLIENRIIDTIINQEKQLLKSIEEANKLRPIANSVQSLRKYLVENKDET